MKDTLDRLEGTLDRQMELLALHLRTPAPRPGTIERIKCAVIEEAAQVGRQARRLRLVRRWVAAAAAVLLAAGLGWPPAAERRDTVTPGDPAEMLTEWAAAVEQSNEQMRLLVGEWIPNGALLPGDEEGQLEDLLNSLDQSRAFLQGA